MRFNEAHDWVVLGSNGIATIGITEFAQDQLGEIVWVDPLEVGSVIGAGEEFAVVESVKAASDLIAPVSGEVVEMNTELNSAPNLINKDAEGEGWVVKVKISDIAEFDSLMDREEYDAHVAASSD